MMLNNGERFTYTNLRLMAINQKLSMINPNMQNLDPLEIINVALVIFSYICDEHVDDELGHGEIVHDIIDDKGLFIYNMNDIVKNSNEINETLNNYLEQYFNVKHEGA